MAFSPEDLLKNLEKDLGRTKPFTDASTTRHAAAYLLQRNIVKKYSGDSSFLAAKAGLDKFLEINSRVNSWNPPSPSSFEFRVLERCKNLMLGQFTDMDGFAKFTLGHAFNVGMVGPGASVAAESNDILGKLFKSKLSCTNKTLYTLFKGVTSNNFRWEVANLMRAKQFGKFKVVRGSNLFTVPKDSDIERVAFTEPTLNMWGQLGYGEMIKGLLGKYHDIDITKQPEVNSWFACSGSLNQQYGTIDLQSASDTISLRLCEYLLPERMNSDLLFLRSDFAKLPQGGWLKLNMVSTMGNGFTFPLQTWIFANLVLATYKELGIKPKNVYNKREYGVYGDDIICRTEAYASVSTVLSACGFSVNDKKSFNEGFFRESCGKDFFKGTNVRAVYFKECKSDAHVYSLLNRLNLWSAHHKVCLRNTCAYLRTLVKYIPVPLHEQVTAGIYTPRRHLVSRKTNYQGHLKYSALEPISRKVRLSDEDVMDSYHGSVIALLHGTVRDYSIIPRSSEDVEYKIVNKISSQQWDYLPRKARLWLHEIDVRISSEDFYWAFRFNMTDI